MHGSNPPKSEKLPLSQTMFTVSYRLSLTTKKEVIEYSIVTLVNFWIVIFLFERKNMIINTLFVPCPFNYLLPDYFWLKGCEYSKYIFQYKCSYWIPPTIASAPFCRRWKFKKFWSCKMGKIYNDNNSMFKHTYCSCYTHSNLYSSNMSKKGNQFKTRQFNVKLFIFLYFMRNISNEELKFLQLPWRIQWKVK